MVSFGQRVLAYLLFALIAFVPDVQSEEGCSCLTEDNFKNSVDHLKFIANITSLKLLPYVRDMIYQADREKYFVLDKVRSELTNRLKAEYGNLINQSKIIENLDDLLRKIEKSMKLSSSSGLSDDTKEYVNEFYKNILPSTFLCVGLRECSSKSYIRSYKECMLRHSSKFQHYFGKEKNKMIHSIVNGINKFIAYEKELQSIQTHLLQSHTNLHIDCLEDYIRITKCFECVTDRMGYCRHSCEQTSEKCFFSLNTQLNNHLNVLEDIQNVYETAFGDIRKAFLTDLSYLVERSLPTLARQVVQSCGNIISDDETSVEETQLYLPSPAIKNPTFQMKEMTKQILKYKNHWNIVAGRVCTQSSSDHFCWNGTNIIRSVEANGHSVDEPSILKNVRPKPKMPEEGSASPWLDDEDFAGSGNGSGDEPIDDDVDVIVTARPTNFLTSAGPTSPAYNRNQMGVTETPGGSSSLSIYVTSILILLISRQIL